ncbi:Trk system potassium transporter TrkA [Bordetella hinzii]|jgi:trk system potassium uptake protein TrkA|uniref:Trk system potassium uptake protein TrkA n=2 Tax=Bordetella hinzii TaxID=103855 RepID=A0AAN1VF39_9BORD|nr:Trk system potassium transporter TrkA [Bordetella hinzii]AKQ53644.1 Trk system potassium uptake protein TrkA [Bordetella hinzii]AKQ58204.1 Trk system potassium uptake protein TrkA [Bordetella hinzii]AZW16454.1 Trk system potassium transporter TrkA [Bordetella hinzii]KCB21432.1 Trk system potassium uptake protein TrkA [Bordetella hinzii L60]KCB23283.1 Trk system potassium uptake protein TrkA [Bordetella hinzii OH87 BAL007II]
MKILIVGAGRVGTSVAENLVSEENDITVVDVQPDQLGYLQERFDLRVMQGDATQVSVLEAAGAADTDLLIACAASDSVNMVTCKIARQLFNVPRRIARIRAPEFADHPELMGDEGFCIDALISPERSVTTYLHSLIEFPEALQVVEFAEGKLSVVTVRVGHGSPMAHTPVDRLREVWPDVTARIVDVLRDGRPLHAGLGTVIAPGDEVVLVVDSRHARRAVRQLREAEKSVHRVMIAGGGNIGLRLARQLADENYSVRIIERNEKRCEYLAAELPSNVLILHGSGTDESLLERENIQDMDTWLALTSDDEDNIMSSLLAKRLGARKVISLINRHAYGELMQGSHIDIAVSPSQATMSELLRHVRRGDVVAVHRLRQGVAEALEAVAHGDRATSRVVGRRVGDIRLPKGAAIGALVREDEILLPDADTVIESDDHVIVFVPTRQQMARVEKLFQVSASFF